MNKAVFLALILGAVACKDDATRPGYNWKVSLPDNDYFNFTMRFDTDAGYRSIYTAEDGDQHTETYGLQIYSFANVTFRMEYFKQYYNQYVFSFIPVDIYPYKQHVIYGQPEADSGN